MKRATAVQKATRTTAALVLVAGLSLSACQSRPAVKGSVADEVLTSETAQQGSRVLDFFDRVQERPVVCADDVITGVLLVRTGTAPGLPQEGDEEGAQGGYTQRLAVAKELHLVPEDFAIPGLRAMSTGEVASLVVSAAARGGGFARTKDALHVMRSGGWLADTVKGDELASGMQLFSTLGGLSDLLAAGGVELPKEDPGMQMAEDQEAPSKRFPELGLAPGEEAMKPTGLDGHAGDSTPIDEAAVKASAKAEAARQAEAEASRKAAAEAQAKAEAEAARAKAAADAEAARAKAAAEAAAQAAVKAQAEAEAARQAEADRKAMEERREAARKAEEAKKAQPEKSRFVPGKRVG